MLEQVHINDGKAFTHMPWSSFSGYTFVGRPADAHAISLRHVFHDGKQRVEKYRDANEFLLNPDNDPLMDNCRWSKWGLKKTFNDVENFQYTGRVYNVSPSQNSWLACTEKDLVTQGFLPSVSIVPWGNSSHLHATIPYSDNIWDHSPGAVQFDSQMLCIRRTKMQLDYPDVSCTFNIYADVYYTVRKEYWATNREEMIEWNSNHPDEEGCNVDRELTGAGYYDTISANFRTRVYMTHDHPEWWGTPLEWTAVKDGGILRRFPYVFGESMNFRVDAGGVGSMQMWVNSHIGLVEAFWNEYAESHHDVGGSATTIQMYDLKTVPFDVRPILPSCEALFPKKERNPDWGHLAARAYRSIPLQPSNGLDYLRDTAELYPQIKSFTKTLKSLPWKQAQSAAKIYLATHYGIENTLRDTADYIRHFRNGRNVNKLIKRGAATEQIHMSCGAIVTARYQTLYDVTGEVMDYAESFLRSLGVSPNMQNLWDLVPYSFVVDWFVNLGDFFKAIDGMFNACTRYNTVVSMKSIKSMRHLSDADLKEFVPTAESVILDPDGTRESLDSNVRFVTSGITAEYYQRKCSYYPQVPFSSGLDSPDLLLHSVEGGALIVQRI